MAADDRSLHDPTGNPRVDRVLAGILSAFADAFPGGVRAGYLFGSHAEGSAVEASDVDLFIVLGGEPDAEALDRAKRLAHGCEIGADVPTDVLVVTEAALLREGHFRIEANSRLVYGQDFRQQMPPTTIETYLRRYAAAPVSYMAGVLRRTDRIVYPLDYPDPNGEFFGYDARQLPPRGGPAHNIKSFVATVCWGATMLASFASGQMVRSRSASVAAYRESVGDGWTGFVEAVYEHGRRRWGYLVPAEPGQRRLLRGLCRQALAFENRYLERYREYLLQEIDAADPDARLLAVQRLGAVSWTLER